ncbi:MAG: SxtJ family membrane protein [Beijerinckiaceae bacterium]
MAIPARLSRKEGLRFAFTLGAAFLFFGAIAWYRDHMAMATALGGVCAVLFVAGLLVPTRLGPVQRGWMRLGEAIGRFMTPVTMGIVYFLAITPVGLIMRAIGKNPMIARTATDSFWIARDDEGRSNLERQF